MATATHLERDELLTKLCKHTMGRACRYIRRLSDIHLKVLEQLIGGSVAETKRRYGQAWQGVI